MEQTITGAEEVRWDLTDLYADAEALDKALTHADADAAAFAERYRGRLAGLSAAELAEALRDFEVLQDHVGRASTYGFLNWSTDTNDAERGALMQKVREAYTAIGKKLIFFQLEWTDLDDDHAAHSSPRRRWPDLVITWSGNGWSKIICSASPKSRSSPRQPSRVVAPESVFR